MSDQQTQDMMMQIAMATNTFMEEAYPHLDVRFAFLVWVPGLSDSHGRSVNYAGVCERDEAIASLREMLDRLEAGEEPRAPRLDA